MKRFLFIISVFISTLACVQGITKNGKITTDGTTFINKYGAMGSVNGLDLNAK